MNVNTSRSDDVQSLEWTRNSWREFPIVQQPEYSDVIGLENVESKLNNLPGLVTPSAIKKLRNLLIKVEKGEKFIIQGGDCAERFLDCNNPVIETKLKALLQMNLIVNLYGKKSTVRIGRLAGQYGKPRSSPTEVLSDGRVVNSFKGDNINGFSVDEREFDPNRLLMGYFHSAATLNCIRGMLDQDKNFKIDTEVEEAARLRHSNALEDLIYSSTDDFDDDMTLFSSHEGLLLGYESALTRKWIEDNKYYDLSGHFVWIGDRTRQLDHAHVEFFRGIENPVGIKVGPSSDPDEIIAVIHKINPKNESGKIVLITRFGSSNVGRFLPRIIRAVRDNGLNVIWQCDPMHGNGIKSSNGIKTRPFDNILRELIDTFEIHSEMGSFLGGVHFELTGEDVTECLGGPQKLNEDDLNKRYTSYCDPRLNYQQSIEIGFELAKLLKSQNDKMSLHEIMCNESDEEKNASKSLIRSGYNLGNVFSA